ncbi:hypothetical protein FNW52_02970 [Flavobacterium sp. ZT3R18]|uniref:hypothetical protein n=1 Tax=Flavobacterium sp. ZT3R18 TaxID=2594429 RepID=UPI00117A729A|nr:hypothetical protein [Flavobacterium sp. ZT3R18]TRX37877.1 hypothetical protein FNW52_02970 [Flavobacterium sp. ZT3R18]
MKHWSEFIDNRTHATKRLAKLANSLAFDVQDKEMLLTNAKANLDRFELQICNKIAGNYKSECEYENAILGAKHKANVWNNTPTNELKNPTHKK